MEEPHVRKRKGRFIKKTDPMRHVMSISDFNLMDICETNITYADNINSNVVHSKLHLQEDLDIGVRLSSELEAVFEPTEYRPVIKPLDFTQEWVKQRKRMANRSRMDDEDDVDFEVESIAKKLKKKLSNKVKMQEKASEDEEVKRIGNQLEFESSIDEVDANLEYLKDESFVSQLEDASVTPDIGEDTMKSVGSAINEIAKPTVDIPSAAIDTKSEKNLDHEALNDQFVPLAPSTKESMPNTPPTINHEERQLAFQEAKSKGYEDGYKDGEEKAMVILQQKVGEIVEEFGKIMNEFEGMKSNILHSSQENFQKVCQSMIEALIQREFKMNPKSFETVLNRAILEAVPNDDFKVLISQETFENIKDDISPNLLEKIKVDNSMAEGNFKIESNLSVVNGNISQIIEDLLNQADIELFDKSQDDKTG